MACSSNPRSRQRQQSRAPSPAGNTTLIVTDAFGVSESAFAFLVITPTESGFLPPKAVITAPTNVNVPANSSVPVQLSSNSSSCQDAPCTQAWTLACPNKPTIPYTGPSPLLTAGPGGDFDTTGATNPFTCNVTLVVTDKSEFTSNTTSSITITCVPALHAAALCLGPPAA